MSESTPFVQSLFRLPQKHSQTPVFQWFPLYFTLVCVIILMTYKECARDKLDDRTATCDT